MAEPPELPWLYPYRADSQSGHLGDEVLRPFVFVSLAAGDQSTSRLRGLVDTGANSVFAADAMADELGIDLADNDGETTHAIGGRIVTVRYRNAELRLHAPEPASSTFRAWDAPVGFVANWHNYGLVVLGSVGFLDQWTVTASRFAQSVAIEERDTFDQRFGPTFA